MSDDNMQFYDVWQRAGKAEADLAALQEAVKAFATTLIGILELFHEKQTYSPAEMFRLQEQINALAALLPDDPGDT